MKRYAIVKDRDISAMTLAEVREIAESYGVEGASTKSKGELRWLVVNHPKNLSTEPVLGPKDTP